MKFRQTAGVIVVAIALASCATTYGEPGLMGGVKATPISADTYSILAGGNSWVTVNTMREFALLKAAETTLAAGATHFEVLSVVDKSENLQIYASGVFMTQRKPGVEFTIKIHSGPNFAGMQDARQIVLLLEPKLKKK